MEKELLESINRNLQIIIGLLLESVPGADTRSLRDRILDLTARGMRPNEIALALGKSGNHVNKELSLGRDRKLKKGRAKK
jgi:hypothetical protein